MGRRKFTETDYNRLIEAFRADAPHFRPFTASRLAACDPKTAKRGWDTGWPSRDWEPIKAIFDREKLAARALLDKQNAKAQEQKDLATTRKKASAQGASTTAKEGKIVELARVGALQALAGGIRLLPQLRNLAEHITAELEFDTQRDKKDPMHLSARQGISLAAQLVKLQKDIIGLSHEAMVMERLHLGKPTEITSTVGELTLEECEDRIVAANAEVQRAKELGGLEVIDGGLKAPVIGKAVNLV